MMKGRIWTAWFELEIFPIPPREIEVPTQDDVVGSAVGKN